MEKWQKRNNEIAKPHEDQMRKAYRIGLRLAQIDCIKNNNREYKTWVNIEVEKTSYYYQAGLKELGICKVDWGLIGRIKFGLKIIFNKSIW